MNSRIAIPSFALLAWINLAQTNLVSAAAIGVDIDTLTQQVWDREVAFARTMANRDFAAFSSHLAEEAIFFSGAQALRGKAAVTAAWQGFFSDPVAPFSWNPDQVQVLDTGDLALSTGPVLDPDGNQIGRFNSIWRLQANGSWKIIFDKGSD